MTQTVLITGASRGIGLELARQYAAGGSCVIATCRNPGEATALLEIAAGASHLDIEPLDVTDPSQIDGLAARLEGRAIDVLINNAGVGSAGAGLGTLDYAAWRIVMDTNLYGPVKLAEALLPNLLAGQGRKVVAISSSLGSIAGTRGGNYPYRTSKAALNMAMRSMAMDLRERGVIVALLSPGIVDTDFTRGARMPKIPVEDSVAGLIETIDRLGPDDAGVFTRYNGETVDW
ncbi:MAG: SDR family oxidoreductase [Pseudomonadota bacterium]|uniref:SDR family oxidoreductase n=1 Tax=Phenylobacterium sp. TaxID=1871053 RepID=UPI0025E21E05|nr:SDR family oxidoreductase [Phenylobacterium sp.]MBT9470527.1 SDR family oxidoreductase [Phenylobacterium sp.]